MYKKLTRSPLLNGKRSALSTALLFAIVMLVSPTTGTAQSSSYNLNSVPINGYANSAFGLQALFSNTTGANNTATGVNALNFNTVGSNNTATGYMSMFANTSGGLNSAYGAFSLSATTGTSNTGIGYSALRANTVGEYNTAVGTGSMQTSTTGNYNTATGNASMQNATTGSFNSATGNAALYATTTGSFNTAFGCAALLSNIYGNSNTGIGFGADVASDALSNATAIGTSAVVTMSNAVQLGNASVTKVFAGVGNAATVVTGGLQVTGGSPAAGMVLTAQGTTGMAAWQLPGSSSGWSLTGNAGTVDGVNFVGTIDAKPLTFKVNSQKAGRIDVSPSFANTSLGYQSANNNTSGYDNTAIGWQSCYANTQGGWNTSVGAYAMQANTKGYSNCAVGGDALRANTLGSYNSTIGFRTLSRNTTGDGNTASGPEAMFSNLSGSFNTANGYRALSNNVSGRYNTALGQYADVSTGTLTNATAIGSGALVNASNKIRIGNTSVTVIEGQVAFTPSDARFKSNIVEDDVKGLEFITKLRPVAYNFDTKKFEQFLIKNMPDSIQKEYLAKDFGPSTAIRQSGFLAQEVEKAAKEVGYDFNGLHIPENEGDNYSLAYGQFVVPLVKAVQEQQQQIEQQQKLMEAQQQNLEAQQAQIQALQELVATIAITDKSPSSNNVAEAESQGMSLYPNPNNGIFTIVTRPMEAATVEVYNTAGMKVLEIKLQAKTTTHSIDLSTYSKGMYKLNLLDAGKVLSSQMVVVQ